MAGSGAPDEWERHVADALDVTRGRAVPVVRPWLCLPCQRMYLFTNEDAVAHSVEHQRVEADWAAWEQEMTQ